MVLTSFFFKKKKNNRPNLNGPHNKFGKYCFHPWLFYLSPFVRNKDCKLSISLFLKQAARSVIPFRIKKSIDIGYRKMDGLHACRFPSESSGLMNR